MPQKHDFKGQKCLRAELQEFGYALGKYYSHQNSQNSYENCDTIPSFFFKINLSRFLMLMKDVMKLAPYKLNGRTVLQMFVNFLKTVVKHT